MKIRKFSMRRWLMALVLFLGVFAARAVWCQDEKDEGDDDDAVALSRPEREKRVSAALDTMAMRVRVSKTLPAQERIEVLWRAGGEGLGGDVRRGQFKATDNGDAIAVGAWSAWLPLKGMIGKSRAWEFPTLSVRSSVAQKKNLKPWLQSVTVDFEFAASGKTVRQFTETAPDGATVGFAFPSFALAQNAPHEAAFTDELSGLAGHAQMRRERLEKGFAATDPLPQQFGLLAELGGYGEGVGYGIRHNNPAIVRDEAQSLHLMGINGLVGRGAVDMAKDVGALAPLSRIYWGGPGSSTPSAFFRTKRRAEPDAVSCPYDPDLAQYVKDRVAAALADIREVGAKTAWAQWGDEIGTLLSSQMELCPDVQTHYRAYLKGLGLQPAQVGAADWDGVRTYPIWRLNAQKKRELAPAPKTGEPNAAEKSLNYYYTYRFMTKATADVYGQAASLFKAADVPLFSMQTPSPTWLGASLDWHEFFDGGGNTALVWETTNRDPRIWQWESYLADIARGISLRHAGKDGPMPFGVLVKPHRGAALQRALSVIARGATAIRWYTYGPDYAKGDSFSERPELLQTVARADRFLAKAEKYLYDARWGGQAEVAFVTPRSSEIWGRVDDPDGNVRRIAGRDAAFEDSKWIYLALLHAHIPVDVLSEQQLAEGKLGQYKVLYVTGPNLRRDAAEQVKNWVANGGLLWTNALGLSRDEANQPLTTMNEVLGLGERTMEIWGSAPFSASTRFGGLDEKELPAFAALDLQAGAGSTLPGVVRDEALRAHISREVMQQKQGSVLASFADSKPAVTRHDFGKGAAIVVGFWPGIAYSSGVRARPDFDVRTGYAASLRALIAGPALARGVYRPVVPDAPTVEAVLLNRDGQRSIALMNWTYSPRNQLEPFQNLRIALPGAGDFKTARSLRHGVLAVQGEGEKRSVILPALDEVDLLILN